MNNNTLIFKVEKLPNGKYKFYITLPNGNIEEYTMEKLEYVKIFMSNFVDKII